MWAHGPTARTHKPAARVYGRCKAHIRSEIGPEVAAHAVRDWIAMVGVRSLSIEPGSPRENGHNESLNGRLRDGLLNVELFYDLG